MELKTKNSKLETQQALREENRNISYLRSLVDQTLADIRAGRFSLEQAERQVENVQSQAVKLFPGKEAAFDLIYRPRFRRAIMETYKLTS